jgi:hypothetical protein
MMTKSRKNLNILASLGISILAVLIFTNVDFSKDEGEPVPASFMGARAYQNVAIQLEFGPRVPGSQAHAMQLDWMQSELEEYGWQVERQLGEQLGHPLTNLIAKKGNGTPLIMFGAHYDSRLVADEDPDPVLRDQPVIGANDGASGVAVLLELARVLPENLNAEVWMVFFDIEDNGNLEGWNWILGSQYFAENIEKVPDKFILVDMVGDADLSLPIERNSTPELADEIWSVGESLGYQDIFSRDERYAIIDDHLPFIELGIPSVDIIDIEYTNWHTSQDNLSKISAYSLNVVGSTLLEWLIQTYQ